MTGKRLTFQEFVERSRKNHGDTYTYHEETYNGTKKHTIITCPIHGDFKQTPKNHMGGQGCPKCALERDRTPEKCAHLRAESKKRFGDRYEFPKLEQEFIDTGSHITIKCKVCGNVFTKRVCDHITSPMGGCRVCYKESLKKYYTYDDLLQYKKEEIQLKPFEGQIEKHDKCIGLCPIHGEYEVYVSTILDGRGQCQKCSGNKARRSVDSFKEEFETRYGEVLEADYSSFVKMDENMRFKCKHCGHVFLRQPNNMLQTIFPNGPCPKCSQELVSKRRTKTLDQFIQDVEAKYGPDAMDFSDSIYTKSDEPITVKCKKCGRYFTKTPNSILQGYGCPYHNCNHSKAEEDIAMFLRDIGEEVWTNDRSILPHHLEMDIYLPLRKIGIEYDGLFWHNENIKGQNYHLMKTEEAQKQGVRLFHVFEDEWVEDNKRAIWKSILSLHLKHYTTLIKASACSVEPISLEDLNTFLVGTHLMGAFDAVYQYGLFHNRCLISAIAIDKNFHIKRYSTTLNTIVHHGFQALLENVIAMHHPRRLTIDVDRRWGNAQSLEKIGFHLYNTIPPTFHYGIFSRRETQETFSKLPMEEQEKKWFKIYDCGYLQYQLDLTN